MDIDTIRNVLPIILIAAFALCCPAVDFAVKKKRVVGYWSVSALVLALAYVVLSLAGVLAYGKGTTLFSGMLMVDSFSLFFAMVFISVALLVVLASLTYIKPDEPHQGEYYMLLLLATVGMLIVASAADLITIFVGLELGSISTYALVAFRKKDGKGAEAAMKFFIIGAFSSAILLYGISLVYGAAGSTNLSAIAKALAGGNSLLTLAIIFIIAGFGFKVASVPFHMWLPDTYEGAPTTITAFLAAASKKMGFAALFKVFFIALIALKADWTLAFGILAVLTMTVGNVIAVSQKSVKRMLAYSSIAQAGYIMIALAVTNALTGGLMHVFTHAFMKAGAFIAVASIASLAGGENIESYAGLSKRAPVTAFAMTLFLLSLAGIPPLAGFVSKFVIIMGAVSAGWTGVYLALALVLNSVLSLYYYARVIKYMYVVQPSQSPQKSSEKNLFTVAIVICAIVILVFGIYPEPLIGAATEAAKAVIGLA
jgi:NADH-quinone oxidoreductase subunit N